MKRELFDPCPVCDCYPSVSGDVNRKHFWRVYCPNRDCSLEPESDGATFEAAVSKWNMQEYDCTKKDAVTFFDRMGALVTAGEGLRKAVESANITTNDTIKALIKNWNNTVKKCMMAIKEE